eukprot:320242-Hanusia_phi.AAC.2
MSMTVLDSPGRRAARLVTVGHGGRALPAGTLRQRGWPGGRAGPAVTLRPVTNRKFRPGGC